MEKQTGKRGPKPGNGGRPNKRLKQANASTMEEAFKELEEICEGDSLSLPLLRQKLEASPEGTIRAHTGDGDTLLHLACYNRKVSLEIVEYLVDLYPEAVKHLSKSGEWHPLHRACLNVDCPNSVIKFLVSQWPDSLRVAWSNRGLPLHCVVSRMTKDFDFKNGAMTLIREGIPLDLDLVRFMVDAYPEALT